MLMISIHICFVSRLTNSIVKQEWNDPKSKLQQCCLTLRAMNGREPDIPVYKVIECLGPTNTRIYIVAVYFRGRRLACGGGKTFFLPLLYFCFYLYYCEIWNSAIGELIYCILQVIAFKMQKCVLQPRRWRSLENSSHNWIIKNESWTKQPKNFVKYTY